jgi:hypothetical protein
MSESGYNQDSRVYGLELRLDVAYEGIDKIWPEGVDKLPLRGKWMTKEDLKAAIDAERQPWKKVRAAKAVIRQFSSDKSAHKQTASQLLDDLKNTMSAQHGGDSENLIQMGFKPKRTRRRLPGEEATLAKAKGTLTRQKRGTKGKKQLEAIKFEGTPVVHVKPDGTSVIHPDGAPTEASTPPATPVARPALPPDGA